MSTPLVRTFGFAWPTLLLVVALHWLREATLAEVVDGLLSGLWFAALFWVGARLSGRRGLLRIVPRPRHPVGEFVIGCGAALLTWIVLWALWALPFTAPLRDGAFLLNSAMMLVAAAAASLIMDLRPAPAFLH